MYSNMISLVFISYMTLNKEDIGGQKGQIKVKFKNAPRITFSLLHTHTITLSITCNIMLTSKVIKCHCSLKEVKDVNKKYFLENTPFLFKFAFKKDLQKR